MRRVVSFLSLFLLLFAGGAVLSTPASAAQSGQICYSIPWPTNAARVLARPCLDWAVGPANETGDWDVTRVLVWNPGQTNVPVWALIRYRPLGFSKSLYFQNIGNGRTTYAYQPGYQAMYWEGYVYFQVDTPNTTEVCVWLRPDNRLMTHGNCPI